MTQSARRLATFADLCALGGGSFHEVLAGELVEKAAPSPEHARAQRALSRYVGGPFDDDDGRGGPGGWWILTEVDVELERHEVVRPDLAGWRRERLPNPWGQRPIRVAPDWVCEILSPSDERRDRIHKAELYARSGVAHYWMVAPGERLVEAFALDRGAWLRLGAWSGDSGPARIPPFDSIELEVARLFPPE
ncbi:MAG: Uma2 family endonuclease [Myxococcales bacterium]|nr:Uma2 family endonuclease [Myxococcales bacterium]